jgi:hypothetical protein
VQGPWVLPALRRTSHGRRAAHLVDHVLPDVHVRQWVLTVPHRLRYLLAWHHTLCRSVARILHRAVERHLRGWASAHGVSDPRGSGVAIIQRFGGSANLHVHVHALVLDGVFARKTTGALRFHAAPAPSAAAMADIVGSIIPSSDVLWPRPKALSCRSRGFKVLGAWLLRHAGSASRLVSLCESFRAVTIASSSSVPSAGRSGRRLSMK